MMSTRRTVEVKVRVSLPTMGKLSKLTRLIPRKVKFLSVLLALIGLGGLVFYVAKNQPTHIVATKLQGGETQKVSFTPDYKTILPTGKTINQLGGWTRVSPPDKNPVFAYGDTLAGSPINVSQQPLPDDFKTDTDTQIALQAQWLHAGEKLAVGPMTVYIANSPKGPQSLIFTKSGLLIMIRSSVKLSNDQWIRYVNSLQ